ncbi:uncharacterized protein TNCT_600151 [Trichonephila clavata]|uniref:Uncharacterized protein n=1 Tax=Trichonephila clavata TaxID=2740835 RepID=A0A8X6H3W1_TRICU|nr:uncharacterized protein TNCT_600151 [Trichonephila clavata]
MWHFKTRDLQREQQQQQQQLQQQESPQLLSTSIINATPLTLIEQQPSGLNGKTSGAGISSAPATVSRTVSQEGPAVVGPLKRGFCRRGGNRLVHPRLSLWGKPMNTRQRHRDPRYRKLRFQVNNFLERPRGKKAILYHMVV